MKLTDKTRHDSTYQNTPVNLEKISSESTMYNHTITESSSSLLSTNSRRNSRPLSIARRVSFADEVNILNSSDERSQKPITSTVSSSNDRISEQEDRHEQVHSTVTQTSMQEDRQNRTNKNNDKSSLSAAFSQQQSPSIQLPTKYRLPSAGDVLISKMDSNLRMLIIKELSKNGHNERFLSRMSRFSIKTDDSTCMHDSFPGSTTSVDESKLRRTSTKSSSSHDSSDWIKLARLVGVNESEIDHWLSQNLQYPAGRVIATWCSYSTSAPTVADFYSYLSSKQLNRPDLARCIETMYSIQ
jgi:hypothetical protein